MDLYIFRILNNLGSINHFSSFLSVFLSSYLAYLVMILLLSFLLFKKSDRKINRPMVVISLFSAGIARFGVKELILSFFDRARPFVSLSNVHQLISISPSEYHQSLPSGHAIFFFALSSSIFLFNKKLGMWFTLCSILIGVGRILVGVHWPSDILYGFILGSLTSWIVFLIYEKYRKNIDQKINMIFGIFPFFN